MTKQKKLNCRNHQEGILSVDEFPLKRTEYMHEDEDAVGGRGHMAGGRRSMQVLLSWEFVTLNSTITTLSQNFLPITAIIENESC